MTLASVPPPPAEAPQRRKHPKAPHRKVTAGTAGAALGAIIATIVNAAGGHLTATEATAISTGLTAVLAYFVPA